MGGGDILPYVYSRSNALQRRLNGLFSDPVGSAQQTLGLLSDNASAQQNAMMRAFADPARPFRVTDQGALDQAASNVLTGVLGFAPAGMVKFSNLGKTAKFPAFSGRMPDHDSLQRLPNPAVSMVKDNMDMRIGALPEGQYGLTYLPQWGAKTKPFYGVGDSIEELLSASQARVKASEAGSKAASSRTLLGRLQKEFGDVFKETRSTQSKSQYLIHEPTGLKFRISDHGLPLHYEQPDVDLRIGTPLEDMMSAIRAKIYGD